MAHLLVFIVVFWSMKLISKATHTPQAFCLDLVYCVYGICLHIIWHYWADVFTGNCYIIMYVMQACWLVDWVWCCSTCLLLPVYSRETPFHSKHFWQTWPTSQSPSHNRPWLVSFMLCRTPSRNGVYLNRTGIFQESRIFLFRWFYRAVHPVSREESSHQCSTCAAWRI